MKPYLESTRRLSRLGLILLVLTVVASIVTAIQFCTAPSQNEIPGLARMFLPLAIYAFLGGIVLAFDGFSFLNKRADSDYYHSLPVSRRGLFWSIALAALTWVAATVLAGVISTTLIFTISKTSFVPLYPLVAVPFYIISAMLVFAAAAIACSLTGTLITDIALTLIVLFLPRFVQFVIARGIVAQAGIVSWIDLPWYLTPVTNIATGQAVALSRTILENSLYGWGNIVYSLLLAVAELFAACLLFRRRHSEIAEHGAKNTKMQTLFACLLVLPILLLIVSGAFSLTQQNVLLIVAIALGCYIIYQIVVLRRMKKVLLSLPWFLVSGLFAFGLFFGVRAAGVAMRNDVPLRQDVAYVEFPGSDRSQDTVSYASYLVSQIDFAEEDVIDYVLSTLRENVDSYNQYGYYNYDYDSASNYYVMTEPVKIVLKNGRSVGRMLTFINGGYLDEVRGENSAFSEAIRSLPPEDSIRYCQGVDAYDKSYGNGERIRQSFYKEVAATDYIPYSEFVKTAYTYDSYNRYNRDEGQTFGSLRLRGYVGMVRYSDYYTIRLLLPETCSTWMTVNNESSSNENLDLLSQISAASDNFIDEDDMLDITFSFYNIPMKDGSKQSNSFYCGLYAGSDDSLSVDCSDLIAELIEILNRSTPTTDPNAFCVYTTWTGRAMGADGKYIGADAMVYPNIATGGDSYATYGDMAYTSDGSTIYVGRNGSIYSYNPNYRSFTTTDQARVIQILNEWQERQKNWSYSYSEETADSDIIDENGMDSFELPAATATPAPAYVG
jgi:ABC-2 type transport system permease protein